MHQPIDDPPKPALPPLGGAGLVRCAVCGELAAPRRGHLSIHYPKNSARPCAASWPERSKRP